MLKIPSLDGWRAVAILIVALSHAGLGHLIPGGLGVTIFFFLSGYLITTLIIEEYRRKDSLHLYHFYVRRMLRLMPPLIFTLLIVYFLTIIGIFEGGTSVAGFASQLLYFANYYALFFDTGNTVPLGTGIFWSLAVEEHFYIFFPLAFIVFLKKYDLKRFGIFLIAVTIGVILWRVLLVMYFQVPEERTYYATDTRVDSIIYGCLMAIFKNPIHENQKNGLDKTDWAIIMTATLMLLISILVRSPVFRETIRYTIQGIALFPLFYYSIRASQAVIFKPLNVAWMRQVGKLSYSIYLIHFVLLSNLLGKTSSPVFDVSIAFVLSYLYAEFIERFVDQHFKSLRAKFRD